MANDTYQPWPILAVGDVVLITHADCDTGYWRARELLTSGCRVVATARQVTALARILLGQSYTQVMALAADIDDGAQRAELLQRVHARFGRITWEMDGRNGSLTAVCNNTSDYRGAHRRTRSAPAEVLPRQRGDAPAIEPNARGCPGRVRPKVADNCHISPLTSG